MPTEHQFHYGGTFVPSRWNFFPTKVELLFHQDGINWNKPAVFICVPFYFRINQVDFVCRIIFLPETTAFSKTGVIFASKTDKYELYE